jgi:stringent starvation protein B
MDAVKGIFARENGQGMFFETALQVNTHAAPGPSVLEVFSSENNLENNKEAPKKNKPTLTIVK